MAFPQGSLVSNILQKSSTLDQKLVESGAQKLSKKAGRLKEEMYEHVRQSYVEFESHVHTTGELREKLREVESEYRRLDASISGELSRRVADSAEKRREIEESLRVVEEKMRFVRRLAGVHESLGAAQRDLGEGELVEAAGRLQEVERDLRELGEMGCEAKVFVALQEELSMVTSEADVALAEEWENCVVWTPPPDPARDPPMSVTLETELRISPTVVGATRSLSEVVGACRALDTLSRLLLEFSRKLVRVVVKPIITNPALGAKQRIEPGTRRVVLSFVEVDEKMEWGVSEFYAHLVTVFEVVGRVVQGEGREGWMREVGEIVCPEMTQLIIDHCLKTHVPRSEEELERYEKTKTETSEFEKTLVDMGVLEEGFDALSKFTGNIQVYYEEQKKEDLLCNARSILLKSIHDTEKLVPPEGSEIRYTDIPSERQPGEELATEKELMLHEDKLKDFGARFPACAVSRCVVEFVELLHETLQGSYEREMEAEKIEVFQTVRELVHLYRAVFPTHHKDDIAAIPAAGAVFYNDCMYVVQRLILESVGLTRRLSPHATFVDLILLVRRLGEDTLQQEMRKQRDSVLRSVKLFGDFRGISNDDKCDEVYRGVRQGLFQITQLSRVYKDTLPTHVHRRSVGNLLDVLVSYLVQGVLALEDIVSSDSSELCRLLEVVLEKGVSVMQLNKQEEEEEGESVLLNYCPSWPQLRELVFVLDARLQEIVDRWAGGKGSLAKQFKAIQIRSLIKALFTNTDRRAAALDKITVS